MERAAPFIRATAFKTGYLSDTADAAFLISKAGRRTIARAAAKAIEVHLARVAGR